MVLADAMKLAGVIFLYLVLVFQSFAFAADTKCEGWYQENGAALEKAPMVVTSSNEKNVLYTVTYKGFSYDVNWDKGLTSFYVSISQNGNRILVTTARVPTDNHPENFTDLHLPNGPRLSVNCEMK